MIYIIKYIYAKFNVFLINFFTQIFKSNNIQKQYQLNIVKDDYLNDLLSDFNFLKILNQTIKIIFQKYFNLKKNTIIFDLDPDKIEVEGYFFLKKIKIKKSVKIIKSNYFKNCINLEYIYIPKNIYIIETEAFIRCINLKKIIFF